MERETDKKDQGSICSDVPDVLSVVVKKKKLVEPKDKALDPPVDLRSYSHVWS